MIKTLFFIGLGSIFGGIARYLLSKFVQHHFVHDFSIGTIVVNLLGCFAIGLFYGLLERGGLMNSYLKLFLIVGFCGSFTTYSTFIHENYMFLRDGNISYMLFYLSISVVGGFIMLIMGHNVVRLF